MSHLPARKGPAIFKTIIIQVDDSPPMDARLQAAAVLAKACGAHLAGSGATRLAGRCLGGAHGHAGLLVAGAIGHSRYRKMVLGGVTRIPLEHAPLSVLFAH